MVLYELETYGWLSTLCFSLCALPQVYKSIRDQHSNGISWGLLILWFLGECFATVYVFPKKDLPLLVNYFFNMLFIAVIIRYKFKGIKNDQNKK